MVCEKQTYAVAQFKDVMENNQNIFDPKIVLFSDWAELASCADDISPLRAGEIAHKLRRLFLDGNRLLDLVNRDIRKKFSFPVRKDFSELISPEIEIYHKIDKPFKEVKASTSKYEQLRRDRFLSFQILKVGTDTLSISEIIKIVANNLGGVHFDSDAWTELNFNPNEDIYAWSLCAAIVGIAKSTALAIEDLAREVAPFADKHDLIFHHDMEDEVYGFNGGGYMYRPHSPPVVVESFALFAAIELQPISTKDTPIYTITRVRTHSQ